MRVPEPTRRVVARLRLVANALEQAATHLDVNTQATAYVTTITHAKWCRLGAERLEEIALCLEDLAPKRPSVHDAVKQAD